MFTVRGPTSVRFLAANSSDYLSDSAKCACSKECRCDGLMAEISCETCGQYESHKRKEAIEASSFAVGDVSANGGSLHILGMSQVSFSHADYAISSSRTYFFILPEVPRMCNGPRKPLFTYNADNLLDNLGFLLPWDQIADSLCNFLSKFAGIVTFKRRRFPLRFFW